MRWLLLHPSLFLMVRSLSICCSSVPCSCGSPCVGNILMLAPQLHQEKLCFCACLSNLFLDQIPGLILPPLLCGFGNSVGLLSDHLPRHNAQIFCLLLYSWTQEPLLESPAPPRFQLEGVGGRILCSRIPKHFWAFYYSSL